MGARLVSDPGEVDSGGDLRSPGADDGRSGDAHRCIRHRSLCLRLGAGAVGQMRKPLHRREVAALRIALSAHLCTYVVFAFARIL